MHFYCYYLNQLVQRTKNLHCTTQGVGSDADSNTLKLIHIFYYRSASGTHRD